MGSSLVQVPIMNLVGATPFCIWGKDQEVAGPGTGGMAMTARLLHYRMKQEVLTVTSRICMIESSLGRLVPDLGQCLHLWELPGWHRIASAQSVVDCTRSGCDPTGSIWFSFLSPGNVMR